MSAKIEIKKLIIKNFRGFDEFVWNPKPGLNIILGGGDCGKSTILEAIGILFHPGNSLSISESDFYNRKSDESFSIEAVISIAEDFEFSSTNKIYWPWEWDGENAILPSGTPDDDIPEAQQPVFRVVATGSSEFDVSWEIIQPDETNEYFSSATRKRIGLVKLGSDDTGDRDLRLVYGSALDRLLSDRTLKSKIGNTVAQTPFTDHLSPEATVSLSELDKCLKKVHLPSGLSIGLTGGRGISIGALIGLLANKGEVPLPLASWGAGTRRMTALKIAEANKDEAKIMTIDEVERGLEPYRLRSLLVDIVNSGAQSFVTTHSPVAISSTEDGQLWYLDAEKKIGELKREKISAQQKRDPETFLSRLSVIVEGETELGFVSAILERLLNGNPIEAGVRVCLGQGDSQLLELLEALSKSGILFGGFVDNDGGNEIRWQALKEKMSNNLFQWEDGCIETNVLKLLPEAYLDNLFKDCDGDWDGYRLRTVAERLEIEDKSFEAITKAVSEKGLKLIDIIIQAATGDTTGMDDKATRKAWKKHARNWFKVEDGSGGIELLKHLQNTGEWDKIEPKVRPFFNSILSLSGKSPVEQIIL